MGIGCVCVCVCVLMMGRGVRRGLGLQLTRQAGCGGSLVPVQGQGKSAIRSKGRLREIGCDVDWGSGADALCAQCLGISSPGPHRCRAATVREMLSGKVEVGRGAGRQPILLSLSPSLSHQSDWPIVFFFFFFLVMRWDPIALAQDECGRGRDLLAPPALLDDAFHAVPPAVVARDPLNHVAAHLAGSARRAGAGRPPLRDFAFPVGLRPLLR